MGLVTIGQTLTAADRALEMKVGDAERVLKDATNTTRNSFDIFLSHSKMDDRYVLGAKQILEEKGYSVYVDWIDDRQIDRSKVNKLTADYLRNRMRQCALMFYLHTQNASLSKWCPWELGFFDGHSRSQPRTFVFPLVYSGETFTGQEYLELYPVVDIDNVGRVAVDRSDVWAKFSTTERRFRQMSSILSEAC